MANKVVLKRSAVQGKTPTTSDLALGELALNTYDGNLFFKRDVSSTETIVRVATNTNLLTYTRVTSNTTAVSRQSYIADTSGGTFTITLPLSPATGDWVTIVDGASFLTTALTVGRNSSTIADTAENLSLNIEGVSVTLVYDGSTWEVYTQVGANGGDQAGLVTGSSTTTFTNKSISLTNNTITGTVSEFNTSLSDGNFATLAGTETLTNKTLTTPTLTGTTTFTGTYHNSYLTTYGSLFIDGASTNNIIQISSNTRTNGIGLWSTGGTPRLYSAGGIDFRTGVTLRDQDTPTGGTTVVSIDNTGLVSLTYTGAGTTSTLSLLGYNSKGGTGYHDFLKITNGYSSATNATKWLRLNSTGGLEIINSAYTAILVDLDDSGNMKLNGSLTMNNRPAFRVIGNGGTVSATTTLTSSNWTLDYQQGSSLNTSTGIFTAPLAGLYSVHLVMRTNANNNSGINQAYVLKTSGGTSVVACMLEFGINTSMNHAGVSTIIKLAVGDTLKAVVTAGSLSFDSNDNFSVAYIG